MFMAKSVTDETIMAIGDSITEVWEQLQFSFELTEHDFDDLEWFDIEPIKVRLKTELVIE